MKNILTSSKAEGADKILPMLKCAAMCYAVANMIIDKARKEYGDLDISVTDVNFIFDHTMIKQRRIGYVAWADVAVYTNDEWPYYEFKEIGASIDATLDHIKDNSQSLEDFKKEMFKDPNLRAYCA